ncbi:MAG: N-acetyltransferase [Planctomycetes bacterium]|nr:N-acetyltransferase [Planctomycetota bacterium]NOG55818.1 GNAT family N-acetyltransferase [Planctomycetota bacterium]
MCNEPPHDIPAPNASTAIEPPTLTTARLLLRPYRTEDAADVARLAGHEKVAASTENIPYPYSVEAAIEWIDSQAEKNRSGSGVNLRVGLRDTGEQVGGIGLVVQRAHLRAELGYWISVPHWGNGYATEASVAMLEYGFNTLNLNRIFAMYFAHNAASGRVMQKLGMTHEGCMRRHTLKDGRFLDMERYAILHDEWSARRTTTGDA